MASKPGKNVSSQQRAAGNPKAGIASTTRAASPAPPASLAQSRPSSAPVKPFAAATSRPVTKVEAKPGVNLSPTDGSRPTREAVAEAAYFLWLQRGGSDITNWLDAEAMLTSKVRAKV
jgi:hypothetical protein